VNMNFLQRYRARTAKYQEREPTSFNKLDSSYCALSLEFMNLLQNSHLAVIEYLYCGVMQSLCRRLLLNIVIVNSKYSIDMALSTTFTQCAPETTKFGKITQNKDHFTFQGH